MSDPLDDLQPVPPLSEEQRKIVRAYRDALQQSALERALQYQRGLEALGIPDAQVAGVLLTAFYQAAEDFLRSGGRDDLAEQLHRAVEQTVKWTRVN